MKLCRVALLTAPALIALSACLAALCTGQAAQAADDLGVAAAELPDAVQKAQDWLGKDCGDARVLYYADGKEPGVFKVRNRPGLAAILDMRLHHLRLGDAERWDPKKTVYGVEFSSDVRREAQHLGADLVGPLPFSAWAQLPDGSVFVVSDLAVARKRNDPTPPPLPNEFNGVTLEQALDEVAEKLNTIVVGECDNPRRIDIVSY